MTGALRNIHDWSIVPHCVICFYGKVGKTQHSHKNQFGDRGDPVMFRIAFMAKLVKRSALT